MLPTHKKKHSNRGNNTQNGVEQQDIPCPLVYGSYSQGANLLLEFEKHAAVETAVFVFVGNYG